MNHTAFSTEPFFHGHVQGIAWDAEKEEMYFAFTTLLVKTDKTGKTLGTVGNLAGHLGCIVFDPARRRVYGSLEMKHDKIGKGVIAQIGFDPCADDLFYAVAFDCDRIDRTGMDAQTDGVMRAVCLKDVCADYAASDPVSGCAHRYGCSGIDGTALGPDFGDPDGENVLLIAYGIYGDVSREDNDHQVLLRFSPSVFDEYGRELSAASPHRSGPDRADARYFFFTGNTEWGVQNLEYDPFSRRYLAAVYRGRKEKYENPPMFFLDAAAAPVLSGLKGRGGEKGLLLALSEPAFSGFPLGQTGIASLGDGTLWFSEPLRDPETKGERSLVRVFREKDGSFVPEE